MDSTEKNQLDFNESIFNPYNRQPSYDSISFEGQSFISNNSSYQKKWKKGDRVRLLSGKYFGKSGQYIFGVEEGDAIVQLDENSQMVIISCRFIEIDTSTPPPLSIANEANKRKRTDLEDEPKEEIKQNFHLPAKRMIRDAAPESTATSSASSAPSSLDGSSYSPLSKLPGPWKQFLTSFLNNNSPKTVTQQ